MYAILSERHLPPPDNWNFNLHDVLPSLVDQLSLPSQSTLPHLAFPLPPVAATANRRRSYFTDGGMGPPLANQHRPVVGRGVTTSLMTANRQKIYSCELCGKSFPNGNKLRRHNITHTGEKPYKCEMCGAQFSRQDHLKRHTISKHKMVIS